MESCDDEKREQAGVVDIGGNEGFGGDDVRILTRPSCMNLAAAVL